MSKVSVADLKGSLPGIEAEAEAHEAREVERFRTELECSLNGVLTLFTVARLASRIDGFPAFVPLRMKNGLNEGFGVERRADGVWHLAGGRRVLARAYGNGYGTSSLHGSGLALSAPTDIVPFALEALGIPSSPEAIRRLADLCEWNPSITEAIAEVAPSLPVHTIHASVGYGSSVTRFLGYGPDGASFMLDAIERLGIRLNGSEPEGLLSNIRNLVRHDDEVFLDEVLQRVPHAWVRQDVTFAAMSAVLRKNLPMLQKLAAAGADLRVVDSNGDTLLHQAVRNLDDLEVEAIPPMVEWLLAEGLDPSIRNKDKETPGKIASKILKQMENYRHLDPIQKETAETVRDMLSGAPKPGRRR